jgi:D-lactate dehydrogenase
VPLSSGACRTDELGQGLTMRTAIFSVHRYERPFFDLANRDQGHELTFIEARLVVETAPVAAGFPAVCAFVHDVLDRQVLEILRRQGTRLIALRSAGFNNVDLAAAGELGLLVARVPAYSPHAVAEHTMALILTLNRRIHRAHARVREGNFALDGLLGFDLHGRTAGIVGTGRIGTEVARILTGFGCRVLAHDLAENPECQTLGVRYLDLRTLLESSDIVTLHCPLVPETHHLISREAIARMKPGVMLINTGRGALVDTRAVIVALKTGKIAYLGLDVYEEEADLFFRDLSDQVIQDDVFARLLTFPNVVVTAHQGFFTEEALRAITATTLGNITAFERGEPLSNRVTAERIATG